MILKPANGKPLTIFTPCGCHSLTIPPEGCDVPARFRREALSQGCNPVSATGETLVIDEEESNTVDTSRYEQIKLAVIALLEEDDKDKLNNDGRPSVAAVSTQVGFTVSKDDVARAFADAVAEIE